MAEYVRFKGIVVRGWNIGFGNGWAGGVDEDTESNGHWEIENCISYSNGRTGFTFFSATNFTLKHSISAHNGSSTAHSWSSGVTLFEAEGTTFTEYLLTQRLGRARRLLGDPRRAGDKISTIALDAGFADVSYFNRAFRRAYGDTPSGVRAERCSPRER